MIGFSIVDIPKCWLLFNGDLSLDLLKAEAQKKM